MTSESLWLGKILLPNFTMTHTSKVVADYDKDKKLTPPWSGDQSMFGSYSRNSINKIPPIIWISWRCFYRKMNSADAELFYSKGGTKKWLQQFPGNESKQNINSGGEFTLCRIEKSSGELFKTKTLPTKYANYTKIEFFLFYFSGDWCLLQAGIDFSSSF